MKLWNANHGDRLEGWAEEVDTGIQIKFGSEQELIRFLRQRFSQIQEEKNEP